MKSITQSGNAISIVLFFLIFNTSFSQGALREIPLKQQIEKSSLIIEGEVISKHSFWDANHHNIYTSNTVKVYKVFKGQSIGTIAVITPGGAVGFEAETVSPSLKLHKGDIGVFMLNENKVPFSAENKSSNPRFRPYSSVQGFYRYNTDTDVAANPFSVKRGISDSFYKEIMTHARSNYIEVTPFDIKRKTSNSNQKKNAFAPGSITFLPTTSTAGTASVLTISGTGFGAIKGIVGFSNADDGGATFIDALDTQVLTWGDTEITVKIPTDAGTGPIKVTNDDTSSGTSAGDLTITYAELNAVDDFYSVGEATDYAYETRHIDDPDTSGSGGYTWEMFTDFFDDFEKPGAKASFERALDTWRCETDVNWIVSGSATTVDVVASDGTNVVRFDNGDEGAGGLPDGVLGRCTSRWSSCGFLDDPDSGNYWVSELDIQFDDDTSWETGPPLATGSDFDFESVALHELGHGHQLGHVIEGTGAVMHYALSAAENIRTLTAGDIAGAGDVHSRSTTIRISPPTIEDCGEAVMTDYAGACPPLGISEFELNAMISLYPNPNKGTFFIDKTSSLNLVKVVVYDISGRLLSEHDVSDTSNTKTINLRSASSGIYFANIHSDFGIITKKLIVE